MSLPAPGEPFCSAVAVVVAVPAVVGCPLALASNPQGHPRGSRDPTAAPHPVSPYLPVSPHSSPHAWTPTLTFVRQAKALQASLMEIVDRVEIVKSEHEKLEGGNKFLQS